MQPFVDEKKQDINIINEIKDMTNKAGMLADITNEYSQASSLEKEMKLHLRMIHVLVGTRVDIRNIDQVLQERLDALTTLRAELANQHSVSLQSGSETIEGEPTSRLSLQNTRDPCHNHDESRLTDGCQDVRTDFVMESIQLLKRLEEILLTLVRDREIHDPSNDKELLGLMDQRMIHTMLEIIVCWGIYPCLLPGVGMPLHCRVRSNTMQKELFATESGTGITASTNNSTDTSDVAENLVTQYKLTNLLWSIIEPLAKITVAYSPKVTRFTTLGSILASRHVPDLYAALLQLAYHPLPKPIREAGVDPLTPSVTTSIQTKRTPANLMSRTVKPLSAEAVNLSKDAADSKWQTEVTQGSGLGIEKARQLQQKEESAKLFHDLFWSTEAAKSLESLTILLSSSSPKHLTPTWLKAVSGRFLSQILLRPGGVRVVLEYMQGSSEIIKLDQLERIARLVTCVPDQMSSVHEYYRTICPELLEIIELDLKLDDPDQTNEAKKQHILPSPQLVQTTTFVINKLMMKNPAICQVEIVAKEIEPLWKWGTQANQKIPVMSDTASMPVGEEGDGDDLELDPLVASEFEISKATMFLHSLLVGNEPSPALFQAFLGQAAQSLYRLYEFLSQVRSVLREKVRELLISYLRILDPRETVEVLKAIVMRRRMPVPPSKPWQALVSYTGRKIADLVEMGTIGESYFAPGPTGGAVLRCRRTQGHSAATQLELDVDVFLDFLSELEAGDHQGDISGDLYVYLLDEYHASKARGTNSVSPRRMLTMLQLILSMTQKLGPSIMSKVTQIIGLASNILEHQMADPTELSDSEDAETSIEIVGLVLTLLSAILTENEHFSEQDRHLLSLILTQLKRLSDHPLIEIRRVAHDLRTLIPTRLDNSFNMKDAPHKTEMEIEMEKYASALAALQDSLLPVRAHGLHILREMILSKSILLTRSFGGDEAERELDHTLDIFVQHIQEPDSFIYLNAVKCLAALTDAHGPEILKKLMKIYSNEDGRQTLDTRLRVGEALVQTVQRCGDALGGYLNALLPGLYKVMNTTIDKSVVEAREQEKKKAIEKLKLQKASEALLTPEERQQKWRTEQENRKMQNSQGTHEDNDEQSDPVVDVASLLRSSALTILATAAETCPTALLPEMRFLIDWVLSILDLDRQVEVRRGASLVMVLLVRALGTHSLYKIESDQLKRAYRTLRYVEEVDEDALCRAQARTGIADLDAIVRMELSGETDSSRSRTQTTRLASPLLTEIRYK